MSEPIFFDSWSSLGRVVLVGTLAYAALVFMLRVSGKRTLSKMNAFDLIVTVALGSTLATVLLSRSVPLVDGLAGLALLIGLQYAITWGAVRSERFQGIIKAEPTVLVSRGEVNGPALRRQRVSLEEVEAGVRQSGQDGIGPSTTVVLETDGSLSVFSAG